MERIAHRGAKREFPENTLAAFAKAYERGADAIELDVHCTRDGVVVVHHDPTIPIRVSRLTNRAIADLDWSVLSAIDLGDGATIPTLDDVLDSTPADATVYVEVKGTGIEERVVEVLRRHDTRCAVHSFDHAAVGRLAMLAPDVPRGILLEHAVRDVVTAMKAVSARDVWPEWKLIDRDLVDRVHAAGGRVIAWTVNERSAAQQLIGMGVDGLCTDDVRLLDGL
ncbi:MAG TPA: glycerophosphodiester phosphodiesterase [Gemmatimonadaceae bacterium]